MLFLALFVWHFLGGSAVEGATDPGRILLSPTNAIWNFLDTGANPGPNWNSPGFDDSAWASGRGPLGYDPDPESTVATVVSYGADAAHKHITTWFRRTFFVTNAPNFQRLLLRILRDDGVVVYLNGVEVFRDNMPSGPVGPETLAAVAVEESPIYHVADFTHRLREGANVIAAEVHQWAADSSDLLFDLELSGTIVRGPYLQCATPTSMMLRWRTPMPTESLVRIGTNAGNLNITALDTDPVLDHSVLFTNLLPETRYFYQIENGGTVIAQGPDLFFRTSPVQARPTRIWAIGDGGAVNWGPAWAAMANAVEDAYRQYAGTRLTDIWLMLGDNAYFVGLDSEYQTAVFDVHQWLLVSTPVWSTIGNHEAYSQTPDGQMAYYDIFSPPTQGQAGGVPSGTKNYFSFDYGNIHFVCLDSMLSDRSTKGPMKAWLDQDLAANTNHWLIAFWHHPPYSKGYHDSDDPFGEDIELVEMRMNFLPTLEAYGVDLVLSGHCHSYERSYLMNGHYGLSSTLEPAMLMDAGSGRPEDTGPYLKSASGLSPHQGTVYVVAGSSSSLTGGSLDHPAMFVSLNQLGSLVIDVDGDRLDARFLRDTGAIDDSFTILKGMPPAPLRFVVAKMADGVITLKWKSEAGRTYRVEKAGNLNIPEWLPFSDPVTASGATTSWSSAVNPQDQHAFFRIVLIESF